MNVAAVRKMTKGKRFSDQDLTLPPQRVTIRCACGWYMKNVLLADSKQAFDNHLTGARHTRRNQKKGPQQGTRDRLAGKAVPRRTK